MIGVVSLSDGWSSVSLALSLFLLNCKDDSSDSAAAATKTAVTDVPSLSCNGGKGKRQTGACENGSLANRGQSCERYRRPCVAG